MKGLEKAIANPVRQKNIIKTASYSCKYKTQY